MTEGAALTAAAAIRFCRQRAGLSARALSSRASLGQTYVCRVEAGTTKPSLRAFARLAVASGMTDAEIALVVRHESAVGGDAQ